MDDITLYHICDEKEILLVNTSKVALITIHMHSTSRVDVQFL